MKFISGQDENSRQALIINRRGITVAYERPRTDGGWYMRDFQTFQWPWVREPRVPEVIRVSSMKNFWEK